MPLQIGKTPIVVPRQKKFNEHVNNHQVEFAKNVAERMGTIIPVEDINKLGEIITNFDEIVADKGQVMSSNNKKFCADLETIVFDLFHFNMGDIKEMDRVLILLATYNGKKYLQEQLDSLYAQKDVEIKILVRDDGSTDLTQKYIRGERKKTSFNMVPRENIKYSGWIF